MTGDPHSSAWDDNLADERATFVSHLQCSLTGERFAPDQLLGLSSAGKPLLVRYDLDSDLKPTVVGGPYLDPEAAAAGAAAVAAQGAK